MKKSIWFGLFGSFALLFLVGCTGMDFPEQFCVKHNGIEAKLENGTIKMPPGMYEINQGPCPVECPVGFVCDDLSRMPDEAVIDEAHLRIVKKNYLTATWEMPEGDNCDIKFVELRDIAELGEFCSNLDLVYEMLDHLKLRKGDGYDLDGIYYAASDCRTDKVCTYVVSGERP